ncbi:hypothetical protein NIES4103_47480 [Nostoc sp. NIES-4103]|nr:hypothetical protein NIES4103_47480 [Nostoc sp. NIES-4103]
MLKLIRYELIEFCFNAQFLYKTHTFLDFSAYTAIPLSQYCY